MQNLPFTTGRGNLPQEHKFPLMVLYVSLYFCKRPAQQPLPYYTCFTFLLGMTCLEIGTHERCSTR